MLYISPSHKIVANRSTHIEGKRIAWIREGEVGQHINSYRHTTGNFFRIL